MKISFTQGNKSTREQFQARAEQTFSTGDGHGDMCLTAYGATQEEAHANLKQLALKMVRELDSVKIS
jgi:hypothetical protein